MSLTDVRAGEGTRRHTKGGRFMPPRRRRGRSGRSKRRSLFRFERGIPCSDKNNSLFSERTGNRLQAIELTWRAALKTTQRGRNPAKVWRNSLLISLFSGNAWRPHRANITKRAPTLLTPSSPAAPTRHPAPISGSATRRRARRGRSPQRRGGSPPRSPPGRPDASAWRRAA